VLRYAKMAYPETFIDFITHDIGNKRKCFNDHFRTSLSAARQSSVHLFSALEHHEIYKELFTWLLT